MALTFPSSLRSVIDPHLPPSSPLPHLFVTLTFATSLDSQLSLSPGTQTVLSGPESKEMTHYLRLRHDAILVGVGTAVADDPGLSCRLEDVSGLCDQPRPVVLDPKARWEISEESKVVKLAKEGKGKGVWIIVGKGTIVPEDRRRSVEGCGGCYLEVPVDEEGIMPWNTILEALREQGVKSVMVEGGGSVINRLLAPESAKLVDSVIVTIAPVWLGQGGVVVSPARRVNRRGVATAALRLASPSWHPLGEDMVLCGRPLLD